MENPNNHYDHILPNGDVHTLYPDCPYCERLANDPRQLATRELLRIWTKFHPINTDWGDYLNELPRTPLDARVVSLIERAHAIGRVMGWIDPKSDWTDVPPYCNPNNIPDTYVTDLTTNA